MQKIYINTYYFNYIINEIIAEIQRIGTKVTLTEFIFKSKKTFELLDFEATHKEILFIIVITNKTIIDIIKTLSIKMLVELVGKNGRREASTRVNLTSPPPIVCDGEMCLITIYKIVNKKYNPSKIKYEATSFSEMPKSNKLKIIPNIINGNVTLSGILFLFKSERDK